MKYIKQNISKSIVLAVFIMAGAGIRTVVAADFPEPGNFSQGSRVWAENCNRCHNMRGPKELRDDQWITTVFHMRVRAGLTGQETRDVITFLQASNTKAVMAGATAAAVVAKSGMSGKDIFNQTCVSCHGTDGKGAIPGVPDFTSADGPLRKPESTLITNIVSGFQSPGSPMAMPPNGGNPNLEEADIDSVLQYIKETFGK